MMRLPSCTLRLCRWWEDVCLSDVTAKHQIWINIWNKVLFKCWGCVLGCTAVSSLNYQINPEVVMHPVRCADSGTTTCLFVLLCSTETHCSSLDNFKSEHMSIDLNCCFDECRSTQFLNSENITEWEFLACERCLHCFSIWNCLIQDMTGCAGIQFCIPLAVKCFFEKLISTISFSNDVQLLVLREVESLWFICLLVSGLCGELY